MELPGFIKDGLVVARSPRVTSKNLLRDDSEAAKLSAAKLSDWGEYEIEEWSHDLLAHA
jgi:hypothetical protein